MLAPVTTDSIYGDCLAQAKHGWFLSLLRHIGNLYRDVTWVTSVSNPYVLVYLCSYQCKTITIFFTIKIFPSTVNRLSIKYLFNAIIYAITVCYKTYSSKVLCRFKVNCLVPYKDSLKLVLHYLFLWLAMNNLIVLWRVSLYQRDQMNYQLNLVTELFW